MLPKNIFFLRKIVATQLVVAMHKFRKSDWLSSCRLAVVTSHFSDSQLYLLLDRSYCTEMLIDTNFVNWLLNEIND